MRFIFSKTLAVYFSCKLWVYASIRFLYPFSLYLATDWGLTATQMSLVLAAAEFASLFAGWFSGFIDTIGPERVSVVSFLALTIFSGIILIPGVSTSLIALLVVRFGFGFFSFIFTVAAQNSVLVQLESEQRDFATGILESSYSLSALAIVPFLGFILDTAGWEISFTILLAALIVHIPILSWITYQKLGKQSMKREKNPNRESFDELQPHNHTDEEISLGSKRLGIKSAFLVSTGALAFNFSGLCISLGINLIAAEFGFLVENMYKTSETEAGTDSIILASGELLGVIVSMFISPESNLPMEIVSFSLCIFTTIFLFIGSISLQSALIGLFFIFCCAEFSVVQRISRAILFANESDANAQLGIHLQFQFFGRTIGAAIAAPTFFYIPDDLGLGHELLCGIALCLMLIASLLLRLSLYQKNSKNDMNSENIVSV